MNDFTSSDKRVPLRQGQTITANGKTYVVCSVVSRGGSAITYDVKVGGNKSLHYILKEFYPKQLEDYIIRNLDGSLNFKFDEGFTLECLSELKASFLAEFQFQTENLPASNSPRGAYFFHGAEQFESNNTAYIIVNTGNYLTLKDTLEQNKDWDLGDILKIFCDVCDALNALHTNICGDNDMRILHLDISDRNILISNDDKHLVKIIDFGSSKKISDIERQNFTISSYTPEFAPIEIKAASQKAYFKHIGVQSDLYSVCAILFKYTVGRNFKPATDFDNEKEWTALLLQKYKGKYGRRIISILAQLLKIGLSGFKNRYESAKELKYNLEWFCKQIKKDKRRKDVRFCVISSCLIICIVCLLLYNNHPVPTIELISDNICPQYFETDTIRLSYKLTDANGLNDKHITSINNDIKTVGFDADISLESAPSINNNEIMYNIVFSNLVFNGDGKKSIEIGEIYKTELFSKANPPHTFTFDGFVEEPSVTISKPNFTRVNAGEHYSVYYDVTFNIPENAEYDVNLDTVLCHGFTSQKITSQKVQDNVHRLIFEGIQGNPGECKITLKEGACKLENGALSRKVSSPTFEIVEAFVPSYPIDITLSVEAQDLRPGGYILLRYSSTHDYSFNSDSWVSTKGFNAARTFNGEYILFSELGFTDNDDCKKEIVVDAGAFISNENGSASEKITFEISDSLDTYYDDYSIPIHIELLWYKKDELIVPHTNLYCKISNYGNGAISHNMLDNAITEEGFKFDTKTVKTINNTIFVIYTNVSSTNNTMIPKIGIKGNVFVGYYGMGSKPGYKIFEFETQ